MSRSRWSSPGFGNDIFRMDGEWPAFACQQPSRPTWVRRIRLWASFTVSSARTVSALVWRLFTFNCQASFSWRLHFYISFFSRDLRRSAHGVTPRGPSCKAGSSCARALNGILSRFCVAMHFVCNRCQHRVALCSELCRVSSKLPFEQECQYGIAPECGIPRW